MRGGTKMLGIITGLTVVVLAIAGFVASLTLLLNNVVKLIKAIKKVVSMFARIHDFLN
jgi:hypothetical protein